MLVGYAFAGCLAALSAIASAQDSGNSSDTDDYILDHVDTPWTFTDCAAPSEMESCWTAQNVTEDVFEDEQNCPHIEKRIQCALTNCWNRVRFSSKHALQWRRTNCGTPRSILAIINN